MFAKAGVERERGIAVGRRRGSSTDDEEGRFIMNSQGEEGVEGGEK